MAVIFSERELVDIDVDVERIYERRPRPRDPPHHLLSLNNIIP